MRGHRRAPAAPCTASADRGRGGQGSARAQGDEFITGGDESAVTQRGSHPVSHAAASPTRVALVVPKDRHRTERRSASRRPSGRVPGALLATNERPTARQHRRSTRQVLGKSHTPSCGGRNVRTHKICRIRAEHPARPGVVSRWGATFPPPPMRALPMGVVA